MATTLDHFAAAMSYQQRHPFLLIPKEQPAASAVSEADTTLAPQQGSPSFIDPFLSWDYGYDQQFLLQQLACGLEVSDYISFHDVDTANAFPGEGEPVAVSGEAPPHLELRTISTIATPAVSYKQEETGSSSASPRANHQGLLPAKKAKSDAAVNNKIGFRTKSEVEILDDGYKWRKYGKKSVKNSPNPRNYYKCSAEGCRVKKRVERDREDANYVITTYDGLHNHISPSPAALFHNSFSGGSGGRGGLISLTAGSTVPSPNFLWPTTTNMNAAAAYSGGAETSNGWDESIPFSSS